MLGFLEGGGVEVPILCLCHFMGVGIFPISTGVWCVPGFGAGFEIALKASKLQKEGENLGKGTFIFCAKLWYAPNPGSKEI